MSDSSAAPVGLGEFRARLAGGVCPAARRSRPADWQFRDDEAMRGGWPGGTFGALSGIHDECWENGSRPDAVISNLAGQFRANRPLLLTALFSPARILDQLQRSFGTAPAAVVDAWIAMYWAAEAASKAVTGDLAVDLMAGDAGVLRPLAARNRFLVSSEPMRWRGQDDDGTWWDLPEERELSGSGLLGRAAGGSWTVLVGRCQQARHEWLGCLDAYQSHLLLAQARSPELEQELRALAFRHPVFEPEVRSWKGLSERAALLLHQRGSWDPLQLSVEPLADSAPMTADDYVVIDELTDQHLLPRFDLRAVIPLAAWADECGERIKRMVLGGLAGMAGLAAVGCAAALLVHQATWIAVGCYGLIATGVLRYGGRWAAPWLLRLPAAAGVGIFALISFVPAGWLDHAPPDGWAAATALVAAACGYLAVEARNHGVAGWALLRSLAVAAIGAVHALMVSLIGLVAVAPAFGAGLGGLWHWPSYAHAGMVLLLASAWCLAVGVFSQILWDDRPITAPLAHLSWRSPS
jgi:hypothetical protein